MKVEIWMSKQFAIEGMTFMKVTDEVSGWALGGIVGYPHDEKQLEAILKSELQKFL